jgi:hypothetical protein
MVDFLVNPDLEWNMNKQLKPALWVLAVILVLAVVLNFAFPFGILPKSASPNCGPEHWRWLGRMFVSQGDVVAFLQEHEMELLNGYQTPRLGGFPAGANGARSDVSIDWQSLAKALQVERRPGYVVYTLTYHHPACSKSQVYTFKVTSYGLASLYGCCGI